MPWFVRAGAIALVHLAAITASAQTHPQAVIHAADVQALRDRTDSGVGVVYKAGLLAGAKATLGRALTPINGVGRNNAWPASTLALAYLFSGDDTYAARSLEWVLHYCSPAFTDWNGTYQNGGQTYQVEAIALAYDLIHNYPGFSEADRNLVRDRLVVEAQLVPARSGRRHSSALSIGLTGYALQGERPEAEAFIKAAVDFYTWFGTNAAKDGVWASGPAYGQAQADLTAFFLAAAKNHGTDLYGLPFYAAQSKALLYLRVPTSDRYSSFPYGDIWDSPLSGDEKDADTKYQGALFAFAAALKNPHLQQQAQQDFDTEPVVSGLGLLFYDPDLKPAPLSELPLTHHFEDSEIFVSRSSWEEAGTHLYFKSGPPSSHSMVSAGVGIPSYTGHDHPSAGHFMIFSHGDWLATEDRYVVPKTAGSHNTLLIDGQGQFGDGENWPKIHPETNAAQTLISLSNERFAYALGDIAGAYPTAMNRMHRHVLHLLPDVIVVADDLMAAAPHSYTWLLSQDPWHAISEIAPSRYKVVGSRAEMALEFIEPANASALVQTYNWNTGPPSDTKNVTAPQLRVSTASPASAARFLTILHPKALGGAELDIEKFRSESVSGAILGGSQIVLSPLDADGTPYVYNDVASDSRFLFYQKETNGPLQYLAAYATRFFYEDTNGFRASSPAIVSWLGLEGEVVALDAMQFSIHHPHLKSLVVDGNAATVKVNDDGSLTTDLAAGKHALAIVLNGCGEAPCQNGGACAPDGEGYVCACKSGYEGTDCQNATDTGVADGGCSCRMGGRSLATMGWLGLILGLLFVRERRRRQAGSR